MPPSTLAELLEAAAKQEKERLANQIAEAQQKLVTMAYDKAAAYTTVVIFGGYAGFFAIWQLTKDHLSKQQALWSALLIMVSLLAFVLFEITKMLMVSRLFMSKFKVLNLPETRRDSQLLLKALSDLETAHQAMHRPFIAYWTITVVVCLVGAIGASGVVGYAFITALAR